MKLLLSLILLLGSASIVYADFAAESFGADPSLPNNTPAIQQALDAAGNAGGGVTTITKAGTYLLRTQGNNPYASGHKYCLEIRFNNITLSLGQGVVLKLADGQQVNSPVDILIFSGKSNLTITGGVITGNTAGQSAWAYSQIDHGIIVSGYGTQTANSNITIKNISLVDHFSNPINIDVTGGLVRNRRIVIENVYAADCGEGIQVIHADDVTIKDCLVESPNHVAVGDAIEVSDVARFHLTNNIVRNHWDGSGFDIFGSRFGVVNGFVVEDCVNGVNVHGGNAVPPPEHVLVQNGIIYNSRDRTGNGTSDGIEMQGLSLPNITFSHIKIKGTPKSYGFQGPGDGVTLKAKGPVSIIECEVTGALDGMLLHPISDLTIRGGSYSNNMGRGIVLLYTSNLSPEDVANLRIDGVNASGNGQFGILIDSQGNNVPKLSGSVTNCILHNLIAPFSVGPESERLVFRDNIPFSKLPRLLP